LSIPAGAIAVTVYLRGPNTLIDGMGMPKTSIRDAIPQLSDFIRIQQFGTMADFLEALNNNRLLIMSDGSEKGGEGASAWILTSPELFSSNSSIQGRVKVPKCHCDSYRAECFGIFGGLWSLTKLLSLLTVDNTPRKITIEIGCDNISALNKCFDTSKYPVVQNTDSDFDIIRAVRQVMPEGVTIKWRHIKGHQQGPDLDI
jgi:hypothetical protein